MKKLLRKWLGIERMVDAIVFMAEDKKNSDKIHHNDIVALMEKQDALKKDLERLSEKINNIFVA